MAFSLDPSPEHLQGEDWLSLEVREFEACLNALAPRIGRYGWMFTLLRIRARQKGMLPHRLYQMLRSRGNEERPYFVGQLATGVKFMGDYRDIDSFLWSVGHPENDHIIRALSQTLSSRSGAFLDIGSNVGIIAASIATVAKDRTVLAFEPVPETARRAASTFCLNHLENVRLFRTAIGDIDTTVPIHEKAGHSGNASLLSGTKSTHSVEIQCRTLDSLLDAGLVDKVALIKIDTEGYEEKVLRGGLNLLRTYEPIVLYEYNQLGQSAGWTPADVDAILQQAGHYRTYLLLKNGDLEERNPADLSPLADDVDLNILCVPD